MPEQSDQEPKQEAVNSEAPVKKTGKKSKLTGPELEQAISPRPSIWPIGLAFAMIVLFVGVITNIVIAGIGVLLIVIGVIGWALERRR